MNPNPTWVYIVAAVALCGLVWVAWWACRQDRELTTRRHRDDALRASLPAQRDCDIEAVAQSTVGVREVTR